MGGNCALLPAIPALKQDGTPMELWAAVRTLEAAHSELLDHGFLSDVDIREGQVIYRFGTSGAKRAAGALTGPPGGDYAAETLHLLMEAFGPGEEARAPFFVGIITDIGPERARAALSDWRRLLRDQPEGDSKARLVGLLKTTQEEVRRDRTG